MEFWGTLSIDIHVSDFERWSASAEPRLFASTIYVILQIYWIDTKYGQMDSESCPCPPVVYYRFCGK